MPGQNLDFTNGDTIMSASIKITVACTAFLATAAFAVAVRPASADQVISDDLIVQGSKCIGVDCVNGENFGAATVRVKENNLRIDFVDTSLAPLPTTDWRLKSSSSSNGGASYFAIIGNEDLTGGTSDATPHIVRFDAGAPGLSVLVNSKGHLGLGTGSPFRDIDVVSDQRPVVRLQQDTSLGATAQDWDLGADNGGFYIGQDDGGLTKVVRIMSRSRNGNLAIAANGNVGFGRQNPLAQLHVRRNVRLEGVNGCSGGIGTDADGLLGCLVSSSRFKDIVGPLAPQIALANVMALQPKVGAYKETPDVPEHWLIAEEAAEVDPAFVGMKDGAPFTVKTQNVVADLIVVLQQQRRDLDEIKRKIAERQ